MADCATLNRRTFLKENAMALARRRFLFLAGGAAAAPMLTWRAWAYPERPVRMIVPLSAGGPTDVFARLIAQKLFHSLGQQFYVEDIPGAGRNNGIRRQTATPSWSWPAATSSIRASTPRSRMILTKTSSQSPLRWPTWWR